MVFFKGQADMPPQCPPSDAAPNHVEPVYRFIENDTIEEVDFHNHKERMKDYPAKKSCEALAISFFTSVLAAKKTAKKFKKLKNKIIVEGKITPDCGIHKIENSHLNLWLYEDVNMLNVFLGEGDRSGKY